MNPAFHIENQYFHAAKQTTRTPKYARQRGKSDHRQSAICRIHTGSIQIKTELIRFYLLSVLFTVL